MRIRCETCGKPRRDKFLSIPRGPKSGDYCYGHGERVIPLSGLKRHLCLCVHNHICAACRVFRALEEIKMKCKHCGRQKIEHREFVGGCFVCPDSHGGRPLTQFAPEDVYATPDRLSGYEMQVLMTATEIYVGLAARHPDAEGTSNHAIAVREAKRLITQVVRDARRQDR